MARRKKTTSFYDLAIKWLKWLDLTNKLLDLAIKLAIKLITLGTILAPFIYVLLNS